MNFNQKSLEAIRFAELMEKTTRPYSRSQAETDGNRSRSR